MVDGRTLVHQLVEVAALHNDKRLDEAVADQIELELDLVIYQEFYGQALLYASPVH